MTSILREWLEKANIEWQRDCKLEDVFKNGYLIGKLLSNLEVGGLNEELFKSEFVDDISIDNMTNNYKLIAKYLCEGGVDIKPKLLEDVANNISGAIHRFIYDLKCFMDRRQTDAMNTLLTTQKLGTPQKGLNAGTSSFKSPPRISSPTRPRKHLYEDMQKRDVETKIRKSATEQFLQRSELKWQKYKDHAVEIEKIAALENEFESQLKLERNAQRHDSLVNTLKINHFERNKADKLSEEKWKINQQIKKKRELEKQHFEKTQSLQVLESLNKKRKEFESQVIGCLDEFEDILSKTQKSQKDEDQEVAASEQVQKKKESISVKKEAESESVSVEIKEEDPLDYLERLRRSLPDKTVSMQETEMYLEQVRANVAKNKKAAEKRKERRKQLIAEEVALNQEQQKQDRDAQINDIMNMSAEATKQFDDKVKSIRLHTKIFKENAKLMKQKEKEQTQKDETMKLKRDREHFEIKKVEFKTKLTIQTRKLNELKEKQKQYEHAEVVKHCQKLVGSIVDITYKSVLYRKLSDSESVPKQLWADWMDLLSKKSKRSSLSLTNVDEQQMKEALSDELNDTLQKEKQCHSDIEHIQKGLIECMDLSGSINRSLINETELKNYLNGKGLWTYNDGTTDENKVIGEPTNDNLGAMIEEIIGVSEGAEPRYKQIVPDVPISIAFVGKPFVGKTTQAQQIADKYALAIINPETCIKAAVKSFEEHQAANQDAEEAVELNSQQLIGQRLKQQLESGKEVDDELYIDTIFDAILTQKDDAKVNGWILDGFPMRRSQGELLEAKLTGFVDTPPLKTGKLSKKKKSKVAPPKEVEEADMPKIKSGLDFVFYMDVEDDEQQVLVERASGRLVDEESGRVYHITQNPPPHDLAIKEELKSPADEDYVATLSQHFKAWDERKGDMKQWFDKFGNWMPLNCNQDRIKLGESLMQLVAERIEKKKVEKQNEENEIKAEVEENADETDKENVDDANVENANEETAEAGDKDNSEVKEEEIERVEPEPEEVADPVISMPWDESLKDQKMCQRLHFFWNNVEQSYVDELTNTFDLLRHERRRILAYLASTREYFYNYLRRKDVKQKLIDAFQNQFNEIHADMRRDDDTKSELHQRIQDLSHELFQCSMNRKNEAIEELNTIKNSVWLDTENGALLKIMIGLIQNELNRYIATVRVINDYFAMKHNQSISEDSFEPIDLLSLSDKQNTSKSKKNKKEDNESGASVIMDKFQNVIDTALQHIVDGQTNENVQYNELQCDVIKDENERLKMRLMRLSNILSYYLQDVGKRHIDLLQKLDTWIGLRIDSENEAINSLVEHVQEAIEKESELYYRLVLEGQNFLIDQDVILCPMPNPIQVNPSDHNFATKGVLTAFQLRELMKLFTSQNSTGIIEYSSIIETLQRLSNNLYAQNEPILPSLWKDLSDSQLYMLLAPVIIPYHSNQYVNWKLFIVSLLMQTLSVINDKVCVPSLDTLFDLKQAFNAKDVDKSGKLTYSQFGGVCLWFENSTVSVWKDLLFDLFECENDDNKVEDVPKDDESKNDETEASESERFVNYNQLLHHLCFNDQSHFGFEKIIAITKNLNIVQDKEIITNQDFELIQMRGIAKIELGNSSIAEIIYHDKLTIEDTKKDDKIISSFNVLNIQQCLQEDEEEIIDID